VDRQLLHLTVENFRSLRKVSLPLGDLNVLVGPNGAGKTNVLEVFRFLTDIIRTDLEPALQNRHGFDEIVFRGSDGDQASIQIGLTATWTANSSISAPDDYKLRITRRPMAGAQWQLLRRETFQFQRTGGRRRITINGNRVSVVDASDTDQAGAGDFFRIRPLSSGLSTLPRLEFEDGSDDVLAFVKRLASFRVFDVDVAASQLAVRVPPLEEFTDEFLELDEDASNLSSFLLILSRTHEESWRRLVEDATSVLPNLRDIRFEFTSVGPAPGVVVVLDETGLRRPTQLADASYGTVRLLGLLALLYDPNPPALTCIEEIDHGLHPQALELLVERLREATERTQFIIATHSPAFADRLKPEELIVCERLADGSSAIPAISLAQVKRIVHQSEGLPLGELWFSGALGGDL
jgi:predicted ATPase